jgi:hypothetical protein
VASLMDRARRRVPRRRRRVPDPFQTLELQARLTRLSAELDGLSRAPSSVFALAHHAEAATRAYDQTLAEACQLIGAPVPGGRLSGPQRLLMEAELVNAGWTW